MEPRAPAAPAGDPFGFGPDAPMELRAPAAPAGDPFGFGPDAPMEPRAAEEPAGDPFGFGPDAPMEPRAAEEPAGDPVAFPTREGGGAGFLAVVPLAFAPANEATPDLAFIPPGTTPGDTIRLTPG